MTHSDLHHKVRGILCNSPSAVWFSHVPKIRARCESYPANGSCCSFSPMNVAHREKRLCSQATPKHQTGSSCLKVGRNNVCNYHTGGHTTYWRDASEYVQGASTCQGNMDAPWISFCMLAPANNFQQLQCIMGGFTSVVMIYTAASTAPGWPARTFSVEISYE